MSIEGPEAHILSGQLEREILGRRVDACTVQDVARLQRTGFVNRDLRDFDRLIGGSVSIVASRGATIRIGLDNGTNLVVGPEYGGRILLGPTQGPAHLILRVDDEREVGIRLTGMGSLRCELDGELSGNYVYSRDFSEVPDPVTENLDAVSFDRSQALKTLLVGKDAVVVGIGNSAFQDICFRAGLHPKHKGSDLSAPQRNRLVDAISALVAERIHLGGKTDFVDLYGAPGRYEPAMGTNRKNGLCPRCGTPIESTALGGGRVFYCPVCQT